MIILVILSWTSGHQVSLEFDVYIHTIDQIADTYIHSLLTGGSPRDPNIMMFHFPAHTVVRRCSLQSGQNYPFRQTTTNKSINYLSLREPEDRCPTSTGDIAHWYSGSALGQHPVAMQAGEQELIRTITQTISKAWYVAGGANGGSIPSGTLDNIAVGISESVMTTYEMVKCLILLQLSRSPKVTISHFLV